MPPMPSMPTPPPALFPTYLIPSLPFRRRKSSTDSTNTLSSTTSSEPDFPETSTSPHTPSYLAGHTSHLRCARCAADLALASQIISKGFTGRHGRAYLVAPHPSTTTSPNSSAGANASRTTNPHYPHRLATAKAKNDALPNLPNTYTHKPVPRQLVTGAHTVGDISCAVCGSVLGWKYVAADEEGQRYKVGKFILETRRVCRTAVWEGDEEGGAGGAGEDGRGGDRWRRSSGYALPPSEMPRVSEEAEVEFDSQDEDECEDLFNGVWTSESAARRRRARQFARGE